MPTAGLMPAVERRTPAPSWLLDASLALDLKLVLDNLNTHFRASFEEVMGLEVATEFLARVRFHYTPKHASWLNMAEIEIGNARIGKPKM